MVKVTGESHVTVRQEIVRLLAQRSWSVGELSRAVRAAEKDVRAHLVHVGRTLKGEFRIEPAVCLHCGYTFTERRDVRSPSRCPRCRSEHIQDPRFYRAGTVKS